MRIAIDPPVRRPLTPNEQHVYKLLQEGLEPLEAARKLHMLLQISNLANRHDVPPDTVMGLIASIREKGWEIPENNKEENNMSRGQKTPVEKVHEISVLKDEGKTQRQIAEITGVPYLLWERSARGWAKPKQKKSLHRRQTIQAQAKKILIQILLYPKSPQMSIPPTKFSAARSLAIPILRRALSTVRNFLRQKCVIFPQSSGKPLRKKIEDLEGKIATAQSDIKEWTDDISKISAFITGCVMFAADEEVL